MKAFLEPIDKPGPKIALTRPISVVGRLPGCDVEIDHASLSRRHAVLVMTDGLVVVRDLITTNGTKVNGKKVRWAALMPNDRISFGTRKYKIEFGPDTKFVREMREAFTPADVADQTPSYSDLFSTSDSAIHQQEAPQPAANVHESESLSEWELADDSQNTELGGWRPGK
jgi:pSer/pThr/pTyr-binding forkhead associated (FHA) protein